MTMQWDDLKTVLAMVRCKTLAGAAKELGLNYTTVARRIDRAERAIGETLFERLSDGYHPTDIAHLTAEHAAKMEDENNALLRKLRGRDQSLTGTLVITAPQLLIGPHLAPVLDKFCALHSGVDLKIYATNDRLDLTRRAADLAIRISKNPGDSLTGIRLCAQQAASFANSKVAQQISDDPDACVDWIVYGKNAGVPKASLVKYPNARVKIEFDDMAAMVGAAQAGLGVVRMPLFLGRATTGLVQVSVLPPQPYADIWVVAHPDVWPSAKVAAFRDILVPHFRAQRACFIA